MKKISISILILSFLMLSNCATIIHGYHKDVAIANAPKELKITTKEGIEIPIQRHFVHHRIPYSSQTVKKEVVKISLRAKSEQVLIFKYDNKETPVLVEGKIAPFIIFLDTITGLYPAFIDAQTGSWYYYDDIHFFAENDD